ncbi:amino acid ABC transporter permease [Bosea sp. (in: a-proteobacteria)]|uniref:amino acid ABC transporter permease n=1 Tax=Bosea sp. (in: a-proteobacteria) TaxID=1871050 RepID=UPI00260CE547|nr:amino acid ABC transporter permease [Bosea sp. (in: a-proteobacteria)]MCO5089769.1 amino acid ABC transporter permease [Bosea sp. (in: a-proteobacteria)]
MTYDWSVIWQYRGAFLSGVGTTILLSVLTMAIALPGGVLIMLLRRSPIAPVAFLGTAYVEFFRNVPAILLVYWTFYVLPIIASIDIPPFTTGLLALALSVTAYNAEAFRAGVSSIRQGQWNAGLALGMTRSQTFLKIVLPQAVSRVVPAIANNWVSLFKNTSLVSVIAVGDLAYNAMQIRSQTYRILEVLTALAVIYWALGFPQAKLVDWLQKRYGVKE